MAKKGKGVSVKYDLKYRDRFAELVNSKKKADQHNTFLGFKLKNINQLWHWHTLEDVEPI